ncbi:MAG: hypothetical protein K6C99_00870 [Lachnospiraceae bacterium]|nr:hypothetical protein [Lachnospiraceae bacterium]
MTFKEKIENLREITRDMTPAQKKKYFSDYYLLPLIGIVIGLLILISFFLDIHNGGTESLTVGCPVNVELTDAQIVYLCSGFDEYYYQSRGKKYGSEGLSLVTDSEFIDFTQLDEVTQVNTQKLGILESQIAAGEIDYLYTDKTSYDFFMNTDLFDDSKTIKISSNYIIFTYNSLSDDIMKALTEYVQTGDFPAE